MSVYDKLADDFKGKFDKIVEKMRKGDMSGARFVIEGALCSLDVWMHSGAILRMKEIESKGGVVLIETSSAYPEAYTAKIGDEEVASLHLRFGRFRVKMGERLIYCSNADGEGKFNGYERSFFLDEARRAITEAYVRKHL